MSNKNPFTNEQKESAERQLKEKQKQIDYDTKDYPIEIIVHKFNKGDFFIPSYQRGYIWQDKHRSLFIESVLLGLPIPFMFFGDCENGKMEIIDGAQRIQTLVNFVNGKIKLNKLEKLDFLNGFSFNDLSPSQQNKLLNKALRVIVLEECTPNDVRQDLFNRINTTGIKANDSEVRRGSYPGKMTTFIEECSKNKLFIKLCPLSDKQINRHERFEFVLRFFTYLNNYKAFKHQVNTFLDEFLINNMESFDEDKFREEFEMMLEFVNQYFPNGFSKSATSKSTPRVRFEALSVGVGLALRENKNLKVTNVDWIKSSKFKEHTTSDASNNPNKLRGRIEYVRDELLKG
jgi:hypothetical protein